jgi:hypothetical protein
MNNLTGVGDVAKIFFLMTEAYILMELYEFEIQSIL